MGLDRDRKLLEAQVKDAANRVDEAEQNALKGGKKAIAKMETRIRELESEIDAENRRQADAQKVKEAITVPIVRLMLYIYTL